MILPTLALAKVVISEDHEFLGNTHANLTPEFVHVRHRSDYYQRH